MNSNEIHALRKLLLHNGYTPLPLLDKGIRIKGWSRDTIDEDWLAKYERTSKYANTGIRCDDLVAFDIDVYDEDLADECEKIITSIVGRSDLCRVGQWPKRLIVYRLSGEPIRSARTGKYGGHMVEVLASAKRQFASFGIHPGTGEPYEWLDGPSPENTPASDLHPITAELVNAALKALNDWFMDETGLELDRPGGYRGDQADELFDLTDDFAIHLNSGAAVTWQELKPDLDERGVWGNITREDGQFGDSGAIHFYKSNTSGRLIAHDFTRDTTHYEPVVGDKLDILDFPDEDTPSLFDGPLEALLQDYVLIADGTVRLIDYPEMVWDYSKFRLGKSNQLIAIETQRGPKMVEAVEIWKKHPKTITADVVELRPDEPDRAIIHEPKYRVFNTYNPPVHPGEGGELDTVWEFIAHLVPDPLDREIFLDWHAMKVVHPDYRMHGLVMTTPVFGTGRGTWVKILRSMFGDHYVNQVELRQLIGQGGQADFNDFRADSLIIEIPEALEEREDRTRYQVKHLAYERIKLVCDNDVARIHIKRKYGKNAFQKVYSSLLICSNHADVFAIPEGDRRLIVIKNTETPLTRAPGNLQARIYEWMKDPLNIGALHRHFQELARSSHYDPFGDPPMTPAKKMMIEASTSDMDVLWNEFTEQCEGDIVTPQQWRSFANITRFNENLDVPKNFEGAIIQLMTQKGRRIAAIGKNKIVIDGDRYRVWVVRNFGAWELRDGATLHDEVRAEVLRNGPPQGDDTNITSLF